MIVAYLERNSMLYGFCIGDVKPFNSTRYYAHIDGYNVKVMYYTPNGYEEFCKLTFDEKRNITSPSELYSVIRHQVGQLHREEFRKNLAK